MNMDGKTVLVTGSTDGVGRYVAAKLASAGAKVLIHGRDSARGKALADEIRREGRGEAAFYQADLSSLAATRRLAEAVLAGHKRLDLFISNAGIGSRTLGSERRTSADGHELRFAVNYLSGFLLAYLLLPLLKASRAGAHRQCRFARPASARFRRCDADQRLQRHARLCAEQARADHVHHRSGRVNSRVPASR